jgi:hypothetical protein
VSEDDQPCRTALERTIKADRGLFRALTAPKKVEGATKETEGAEKKN